MPTEPRKQGRKDESKTHFGSQLIKMLKKTKLLTDSTINLQEQRKPSQSSRADESEPRIFFVFASH
jgi:hypothetical protein